MIDLGNTLPGRADNAKGGACRTHWKEGQQPHIVISSQEHGKIYTFPWDCSVVSKGGIEREEGETIDKVNFCPLRRCVLYKIKVSNLVKIVL